MTLRIDGAGFNLALAPVRTDPFGRQFLLDAATGLVLPGFAYSRSGPALWLPQQDGSLSSFGPDVLPRSWGVGGWGYEFHPGWTNSCLWSDELTADKGWVIAGTPEVNVGGLVAPHGGSYTRLTFTSGVLSLVYRPGVAVTPGQSLTMSFMLRLGTMPASDWKCGIYNETAGSWIAVDQQPVTPSATGWTRVDLTVTVPAGCTSVRLYPFRNSPAVGGTLFICMVNGTNTSYPVPLTVATTAPGTIGTHTMGATLSALGITLGSEYGVGVESVLQTLVANYQPISISISDSGFNESIYQNAATLTANREPNWAVIDGGVGQANSMGLGPATVVGQLRKTALRVKANDFRSAFNGSLTLSDQSGTLPTVDRVFIGLNWSGTSVNAFQGRITRAYVIPNRAPSDADLAAMTA